MDESRPPVGGVPEELGVFPPALRPAAPLPAKAKIVIIGGGVMGLALAYNLSLRGETDVVVLERGYLCAGASGRNGGGVRMQWGTAANIELAKRSIDLMKQFARDLGINVWLRQGGYLFLAKTPDVAKRLEKNAALHNKHGVPTRIITADAAREIVPGLTMKGVVTACVQPGGRRHLPLALPVGLRAAAACKKGIKVETFTQVTGFEHLRRPGAQGEDGSRRHRLRHGGAGRGRVEPGDRQARRT